MFVSASRKSPKNGTSNRQLSLYGRAFYIQKTDRLCDRLCAPQVGLEPTTTRLTAGCSAIELLRNIECRQRPILPGRVQPSTFGTEELNCCVRYGNRWNLFVITTGPIILSPTASHVKHKFQIYPVYSHAEDISTRGSSSVSIIAARRFSPIPFTSSKSVGRR